MVVAKALGFALVPLNGFLRGFRNCSANPILGVAGDDSLDVNFGIESDLVFFRATVASVFLGLISGCGNPLKRKRDEAPRGMPTD